MIIHDVAQGEIEWFECRKAIPTASEFKKIITPKKLEYSASSKPYMYKLIAEIMLGRAIIGINTTWMERGRILESEALKQYAYVNEAEVTRVGFITDDNHHYGCSPDGIVEATNSLVEIKCLSEAKHVEYLLTDTVPDDYKCQVQGQLFVTGCDYVDWFAYYPGLVPAEIRTDRDEEYIGKLEAGITRFRKEMNEAIEKLQKDGKWSVPYEEAA